MRVVGVVAGDVSGGRNEIISHALPGDAPMKAALVVDESWKPVIAKDILKLQAYIGLDAKKRDGSLQVTRTCLQLLGQS